MGNLSTSGGLPTGFSNAIWLAAMTAFAFTLPWLTDDDYHLHVLIQIATGAIMAVSFRLMYLTGRLSIAHAAFAAIGAYTSALLVMRLGLSFWLALPCAGVVAACVAIAVGYPALRTRGVYFAIVTLGVVEITNTVFRHYAIDVTGGAMGLLGVPRPNPVALPGFEMSFDSRTHYYFFALALMLASVGALYWLEKSRFGMTLFAIRQSEALASSVGVNATAYLLAAFAITAFFAGLTGSFLAHYLRIVSPHDFTFAYSTKIITYAVIGGMSTVSGPILGATFLTILTESLREFGAYYDIMALSAILIFVLLFQPEGISGIPRLFARKPRIEIDKTAEMRESD